MPTTFIAPTSGVLLEFMSDALDLAIPRKGWRTLNKFLDGERVLEKEAYDVLRVIAEELVKETEIVRIPVKLNAEAVHGLLIENSRFWDRFVGQSDKELLRLLEKHPYVRRAFARLLMVDVALRVAGFRFAAGLPTVEDFYFDKKRGDLVVSAIKGRGTRDQVAGAIDVHPTTLDEWCSDGLPDKESIKKLARFLAREEEAGETPKQLEWRGRLLRHRAAWRLYDLVRDVFSSCEEDQRFFQDLPQNVVYLVNCFTKWFEATANVDVPGEAKDPERFKWFVLGYGLEGRNKPMLDEPHGEHATVTRRGVAKYLDDEHLREALMADDIVYTQSHAEALAGTLEMLRMHRAVGFPIALLEVMFGFHQEAVWDGTGGLVPVGTPPGEPRLAMLLADAHGKRTNGDVEGARALYESAAKEFPESGVARLRLAAHLGETGHIDEALRQCSEAVALVPGYVVAREELGALLLQAERPLEARAVLLAALDLVGGEATASAEHLYQLGVAHLMIDEDANAKEADRVLSLAVERAPRDSMLLAAAATAAALAGDRWRGIDSQREATFRGLKIELPRRKR